MTTTLTFTIDIQAPRRQVWAAMLGDDTYRQWTAAFCEGSHFVGSWDEGAKIRFMSPRGDGMTAEIAQSRPFEFVSIRHLGEVRQGVEDTTSEAVKAWAPAYENFSFADHGAGCTVTVSVDTVSAYEAYMRETYPKALALLKALCERQACGAGHP